MEYDSDIKKNEGIDSCNNIDEYWKHYAKWKKPDIEDHILYDLIYKKCQDQVNP